MRRTFFVVLFCALFCFPAMSQSSTTLLNIFFGGNGYTDEKMGITTKDGMELYLARQIESVNTTNSKKVLVYGSSQNGIRIFLQILGPMIVDSSGRVIADVSSIPGAFWAWRIELLRKSHSTDVGLSIDCISNSGKSITDYPSIVWDETKNAFYLDTVDRSQF